MQPTVAELTALIGAAVLFLGGVGSLIVNAVSSRNAAKKADLDDYILKAQKHAEEDAREFESLSGQLTLLRQENGRLEEVIDRRRVEINRLFDSESALRKEVSSVREELSKVRDENVVLRRENTNLRERTAALEQQVALMTDERAIMLAALDKAGVKLQGLRRRGDTGPLPPPPLAGETT